MENAYIYSTDEALDYFQVSEREGLSEEQVQRARKQYGRNSGSRGSPILRKDLKLIEPP